MGDQSHVPQDPEGLHSLCKGGLLVCPLHSQALVPNQHFLSEILSTHMDFQPRFA